MAVAQPCEERVTLALVLKCSNRGNYLKKQMKLFLVLIVQLVAH
jgi:hypothetical protein